MTFTSMYPRSNALLLFLLLLPQVVVVVDALFGSKQREEAAREEAERLAEEAEAAARELARQEDIIVFFGIEFDKTAFWIITGILSTAGIAYGVYVHMENQKKKTVEIQARGIGNEGGGAAATTGDTKTTPTKITTNIDTEKLKQDAKKVATQAYVGAKQGVQVGYAGAKQGVQVGTHLAHDSMDHVKAFIMDGPVPFRALMFGGGCAVVVASIRDMVEEVFIYDFYQTFASVFNVCFGILIILLESTALFRRTPWRKTLYEKASFLKSTFGRGFFYVFIGINMGSQNFGPFSTIVSIYILVLGITAVVVGYWTQRKVTKLRQTLKDENMVKETFDKMDTNHDGSLDQEEFATLCESLGVPMKKVELLAIFDVLDTSEVNQKKNTITFQEFQKWWKEWDEFSEVI